MDAAYILLCLVLSGLSHQAWSLRLEVSPKSVIQARRSSVWIDCKVTESDGARVQWIFNKEPVSNDPDEDVFVYPNNTLYIKDLRRKYTGTYRCEARTQLTNIYDFSIVKLASLAPMKAMKDAIEFVGNTVNITCHEPKGHPPAMVRWEMDDGKPLPTDSRYRQEGWSLIIERLTTKDRHNFTCIAENLAKERRSTMRLRVFVPGGVTVRPRAMKEKEGASASFDCRSLADPPLPVTWRKKTDCGRRSRKAVMSPEVKCNLTEKRFKKLTNGTLIINPITVSDNGTFQCVSEMPETDAFYEQTVELHVLELLKVDDLRHNKKQYLNYLKRKDTQGIVCQFRGYGSRTITWRKEGLAKLPSHMTPSENKLYITDVSYSDNGKYVCEATGPFNSVEGHVELQVYEPLKFTTEPKDTSVTEEDPAWISCNGSGVPKPKISWERAGGNLTSADFEQMKNGTLKIKKAKMSLKGDYFCILANGPFIDNKKFTLAVKKRKAKDKSGHPGQQSMGRTVGIAVGCAGAYILLVVGLMIYCRSRRSRLMKRQGVVTEIEDGDFNKDPLIGNGDYAMDGDVNDRNLERWQFPREDLEELHTLGCGKMGRVYVAKANGIVDGAIQITVAVKELEKKEEYRREEFERELDMFSHLQHDHVVRLLGICTMEFPLCMITEYSEQGDLKQFLKAVGEGRNGQRPNFLTAAQKASMCHNIASGMQYLAVNRFIHRDLAARNCVVTSSLEVKVGFFSLCEDLYARDYYTYNGVSVPLRWLSPEAIDDEHYSEKSDVWAFGITVWEIFSLGQQPYSDFSDEEVLRSVRRDVRLSFPRSCPNDMVRIIEPCWAANPDARPTFDELVRAAASVQVDSDV